jgi:riboflavin synthase
MFTGIVQGLCPVSKVVDDNRIRRLRIDLGQLRSGLQLGASVAINGTCLTVTELPKPDANFEVQFDVIGETLDQTNLSDLTTGALVNVERSFRVGDEIGGHVLSGHVSATAEIASVDVSENERTVYLSVPEQCLKFLHHKGFVALDGASLTIASVDADAARISVCLIPETIARTTLGTAKVGQRINLEVDAQTQAIVETVERVLSSPQWREQLSSSHPLIEKD